MQFSVISLQFNVFHVVYLVHFSSSLLIIELSLQFSAFHVVYLVHFPWSLVHFFMQFSALSLQFSVFVWIT